MSLRICICIVFLNFSLFSFGQIDTAYIQSMLETKTIAFHSTLKNFRLNFSAANSEKVVLQNNNLGLGVRLRYRKVGISLAVPIVSFNQSSLGKPKTFGFGFNLFPSAFFLQGTFQYIRGFDDLDAEGNENKTVFRGDNQMIYASLIGNYVFNHKRFSLGSAFKMLDIQKRSAGSWIVAIPINYQYFETDSLQIPLENLPDFQLDLYKSFKIGLGGGYAYTKVKGNWSATIFATGGAEFRNLKYRNALTQSPRNKFLISPRIRLVSSVLYNTPSFFYGIVGQYLPALEVSDGLNTRVENYRIRIIIGKRFSIEK